jgi:hypothetical protein
MAWLSENQGLAKGKLDRVFTSVGRALFKLPTRQCVDAPAPFRAQH